MRKPAKNKSNNVSAILVGDTLGELVSKLDIGEGEGEARLIVIAIKGDGEHVNIAHSEGIGRAELIGTLYMAIDWLAMNVRE